MVMTADVTATDQQLTPTAPSAERFSVSELLNPPVGRSGGFLFTGIWVGYGWSVLRFGVLRGRGSDFGYPLYIDDAVGFSLTT
jgi:hypothetical protein